MKVRMLALVAATLALVGCGSVTGPDEAAEANAARARQALNAAAQPAAAPSHRISSN